MDHKQQRMIVLTFIKWKLSFSLREVKNLNLKTILFGWFTSKRRKKNKIKNYIKIVEKKVFFFLRLNRWFYYILFSSFSKRRMKKNKNYFPIVSYFFFIRRNFYEASVVLRILLCLVFAYMCLFQQNKQFSLFLFFVYF